MVFLPWALLELFAEVVWQPVVIFPPLLLISEKHLLWSCKLIPTLTWSVLIGTSFTHPCLNAEVEVFIFSLQCSRIQKQVIALEVRKNITPKDFFMLSSKYRLVRCYTLLCKINQCCRNSLVLELLANVKIVNYAKTEKEIAVMIDDPGFFQCRKR